MMFHPLDRDLLAHDTLASVWVTFAFRGKPAHAAAAPHEGASALTACMDTFRLIDGQRVHFKDGVRVHGYITNGGQAVNIIPERAACEFSVRARHVEELERVRAIVERCARGAAMASGVELALHMRPGYKDMRNNLTLARVFGAHPRPIRGSARAARTWATCPTRCRRSIPTWRSSTRARRCATSTGSRPPPRAIGARTPRSRPRGRWPRRRSSC